MLPTLTRCGNIIVVSLLKDITLLQEEIESIQFVKIDARLYDAKIEIGISNKYYPYDIIEKEILSRIEDNEDIITFIYI